MFSSKIFKVPFYTTMLALVALSSCQPKNEITTLDSTATPNPAQPTTSDGLQSSYCAARFIKLSIESGQYTLYVNDLGDTPIPMTGTFENNILSLSGESNGHNILFLGAITPDGSVMSTNMMLMDNGIPVHSIKSIAMSGACATTSLDTLPKIAANPIHLTDIKKISRYRSPAGHNYNDASESCRSMKHYFEPISSADQTTEIYAPFRARVLAIYNDDGPIGDDEINNQHITLQPLDQPAIQFEIFHTELTSPIMIGSVVEAGTLLGWADLSRNGGMGSDFDFAVHVNTVDGVRTVSMFDLLTDGAFAEYVVWSGLNSRDQFKISKTLRNANPLQCANDSVSPYSGQFINKDNDSLLSQRWVEGL